MNTISNLKAPPITQVIVYCGHVKNPLFGPYGDNIQKRIDMFKDLNPYRIKAGRNPWNVKSVPGEELVNTLENEKIEETLLVIPAGQSTNLEAVFLPEQIDYLREEFFGKGGRAYFTCGASYWVSKIRIYNEVCLQNPEHPITLIKESTFPIFQGT